MKKKLEIPNPFRVAKYTSAKGVTIIERFYTAVLNSQKQQEICNKT